MTSISFSEAPRRRSKFVAQLRIIALVTLREVRLKFAESKLSYLLAMGEPALQISVMFAIFWAMDRQPDFGTSIFLFLITGFVPYFLFTNISSGCSGSIRAARAFRNLPAVNALDVVFARALLEFLTHVIVFSLVLVVMWIAGIQDALPVFPGRVAGAVLGSSLLGLSVGLFNAVVSDFFVTWRVIYGVLCRSLLFVSAVFYVPDLMPVQARQYLVWNPLLHCIEWFRTGFYMTYPTMVLDIGFVMWVCLGAMVIGLTSERLIRAREAT